MRKSDHYFFRPTRFASISVCPSWGPERNGQSLDLMLDVCLVSSPCKVHATRSNKYRKSDGITIIFGIYAYKVEQLARAQL